MHECRKRQHRTLSETVSFGLATALVVIFSSVLPDGGAIAEGVSEAHSSMAAESQAVFAGLDRIDEAELAELRGGLSVGGIDIQFGATLRTLIDNVELVTSYRISEAGIDVLSHHLGSPSASTTAQPQSVASQLGSAGSKGNAIPITIVSQPPSSSTASRASPGHSAPVTNATLVGPDTGISVSDLAPSSIKLSGIENYRGIVVSDVKGFTAALHNISRKAVISSLVSNASNRKISQRIDLDIRLGNISQLRSAAVRSALSRNAHRR